MLFWKRKESSRNSFFKRLGPGFITGASDDDPSGIATYAQTGVMFGYGQLWLAVWTLPFMIAIQGMCGKIGLITGKGIAAVIKDRYPRWVLLSAVSILVAANTVNIGADLGAMASAAELLIPLPFEVLLSLMTVMTILLQIFVPYRVYVRYLKFLALALLAYIFAAFSVHQDWMTMIVAAILPQVEFTRAFLLNLVAFLGTTISPYLFFWQAGEEAEESVLLGRIKALCFGKPRISSDDLLHMEEDTATGMFFSNTVSFFIIATAAGTLRPAGITSIETADQMARALEPFAGQFASLLFALGIVGTGLLAVPVLAGSASYAVSETFRWKEGLSLTLRQARGFYGVIAASTMVGFALNFVGIAPFRMLYLAAVCNGVLAAPLMVLILLASNDRKVVGKNRNTPIQNILGWIITIVMAAASIGMFVI